MPARGLTREIPICRRFAIGDPKEQDWADWLGVDPDSPWPEPSWNLAPTQTIAMLGRRPAGGIGIALARWGLIPHWWRKSVAEMKATTFNARAEEAAEKPMFRTAWARHRCLIPALGYYEWSGPKGQKQPWFVTLKRNAPGICFAGLWARAETPEGPVLSATILTTAAGEATRHLHPRSPVILEEAQWDRWLSLDTAVGELMQAPEDERVDLWPVSPAVGKVGNDGPELIERDGLEIWPFSQGSS